MWIEKYLGIKCSGDYAFWVESQAKKIHYAEPLIVGSVSWPAEVVLLQCLAGIKKALYGSRLGLYQEKQKNQQLKQPSLMGAGMAAHLGVKVSLLPEKSPVALDVTSYNEVSKLQGSGVLARSPTWARVVDGFSPEVDLVKKGAYLHRLYIMAAFRLIYLFLPKYKNVSSIGRARSDGHNIAALIVEPCGLVRAIALNSATENKTFHAEVNALQALAKAGEKVPSNCFVYTTMKPCDMCAAMITALLPNATVIYAQDDPKAKGTIVPTGGMSLLSSLDGVKQVQLVKPNFQKAGNFATELVKVTQSKQEGKSTKDPFFYLTNVVDSDDLVELMIEAQRGLEAKSSKYSQKDKWDYYGTGWGTKHPEVAQVLVHLAEILDLKIKEPEPDWGRLLEDFPHLREMDLTE